MNCTINGIEYESRNNTGNHCDGCVATNDTILCQTLPSCGGIIWVKSTVEPGELSKLKERVKDLEVLLAKAQEEPPFPHGKILKVHVIGPYKVIEYRGYDEVIKFEASNLCTGDDYCSMVFPSLDYALVAHICNAKHPGDDYLPEYVMRLINSEA